MTNAYPPIESYGIIGNTETSALVDPAGTIDWYPVPHVESPSVFARLLDSRRGGHFAISPAGAFEATQRYVDRTNVLRTNFETASGRATVTDFMPVPEVTDGEEGHRALYCKVACDDGRVDLDVRFEPRFDYARTTPSVERTASGVVARGDDEAAFLSSSVSPWLFGGPRLATASGVAAGALLILLSIPRGQIRDQYGFWQRYIV